MASGLAALLDDISAITKAAAASIDDVAAGTAKAGAKAIGVVVDDTAVTPQYVSGISPKRELPIVAKIARGSLINKAAIIVVALLLNHFFPILLTPILMLGGSYLCFEGAEKVVEYLPGHRSSGKDKTAVEHGPEAEKKIISGATRTDLILSAEIMVVALGEIRHLHFGVLVATMVAVAISLTLLVYGVVALLVKMDDVGLALMKRESVPIATLGRFMVRAMPVIMKVISVVGVFAMIWVGGHLVLSGSYELGLHYPYAWVHELERLTEQVSVAGAALAWTTNTLCSLVFGFLWGVLILGAVAGIKTILKR